MALEFNREVLEDIKAKIQANAKSATQSTDSVSKEAESLANKSNKRAVLDKTATMVASIHNDSKQDHKVHEGHQEYKAHKDHKIYREDGFKEQGAGQSANKTFDNAKLKGNNKRHNGIFDKDRAKSSNEIQNSSLKQFANKKIVETNNKIKGLDKSLFVSGDKIDVCSIGRDDKGRGRIFSRNHNGNVKVTLDGSTSKDGVTESSQNKAHDLKHESLCVSYNHDNKNNSNAHDNNNSSNSSKKQGTKDRQAVNFTKGSVNVIDASFEKAVLEHIDDVSYQNARLIKKHLYDLKYVKKELFEQKKEALLEFSHKALLDIKSRKANLPKITYDKVLPVASEHDRIVSAIVNNQVVIIAGETGSGKTTQIPKMCLEAGLGIKGLIGHTQPRRIAARAVANRIASELNEPLGKSVGYKVRFTDTLSESSYIKLMTDGILLAETANDRLLLNYDCIIIDESHERSLNIDFLLGYLKNILQKRPELKLIITSATIDPERFAKHFNDAPIIEVSGRTYPVEVVYMPLLREKESADDEFSEEEIDLKQGVLKAIDYLMHQGRGDVLVFLPGERDIMEMAAFLKKVHLRDTEILPLYARLATAEQNKIFTEHTGVRIVLATNVAETSLTVPGIKYVIDPGNARISRYSAKTKVQRLPIEPISQASANQRKGRCGRVSDGICVRLYSKEDFESRPLYTDPEILRTNLAAVILQMVSLHLGDINKFPFIDAPTDRQISDGLRLLEELGALKDVRNKGTDEVELTKIGQLLSKIPADPRLSRMIVEASELFSLNEVLIIVSALAVMDVRERPHDKQEQSDNYHKRFNDSQSDFISYLKLYAYISGLQKELSQSAFKRQLKKEFISYLRVREWFDLHRQLRASAQSLGFKFNEVDADYESIHKAIVSGLLSQIGMLDIKGKLYTGARGIKFLISNTSGVSKNLKWICACEISETTRLFARTVASINPLWLETIASHLIKKSYADPHWSAKQGATLASQTISLYGLPIVQSRICQYSSVDPKLCREFFIRDGLVYGDINCKHQFFKHNLKLIEDIEYLEDKTRRRDLLVDDKTMQAFYEERIPYDVVTQRHFDKWWAKKSKEDPKYLDFPLELIAKDEVFSIEDKLYPEYFNYESYKLKLSYVFDIASDRDGVSVHIPITVLNQIKDDVFTWQIPAFRKELVSELIRSLPKAYRRNLIPAPDYAKAFLERVKAYDGNLYEVAAREFTRMGGQVISKDDFDLGSIPSYLFITFVIEDIDGKELSYSKNLRALNESMQGRAKDALQSVVAKHKVLSPSDTWRYGTIERQKLTHQGSLEIVAYPALTVKGQGVTLELFDSKERQERHMWEGQRKLLSLSIKNPTSYLEVHLPNKAKLSMYYQPLGSVKELIDDLVLASIDLIMQEHNAPVWSEAEFNELKEIVRANLNEKALQISQVVEQILYKAHELKRLLKGKIGFDVAYSYADISKQLDGLVYKGFVSSSSLYHLEQIPRYLQAAIERVNKLTRDVNRDRMYMQKLDEVQDRYYGVLTRYEKDLKPKPLLEVKWMIEELRVSYFAQQLGVKGPISDRRIYTELDNILKDYKPLS